MSWRIEATGKGPAVLAAVQEQAAQANKFHGSEPHHEIVTAHIAVVAATVAQKPDRAISVESYGHIDGYTATAVLNIKGITLVE